MARLTRRSFTVGAAALSAAACGTRMPSTPASPAIVVDRPSALVDAPVKIELKGSPAGQPVTITATLEFADTSRWQSRATFATDAGGDVDLTREAPISGTYEGVAAMGLIWSAERLPGEWLPIPPGSVMRPWFVHLASVTRHLISVPYGPTTLRVISLSVQGVSDLLLSQGGTPRADAEAGIDAWRDLLQFLEDGVSRHAFLTVARRWLSP